MIAKRLGRSQHLIMAYVLITIGKPPGNLPEIEPWTAIKVPSHEEIQNLVGIGGVPTTYEILQEPNFSDRKIVTIVDSDLNPKGLKPTCFTKNGSVIHGQVLILASGGCLGDLQLLTLSQVRIVNRELKLYRPQDVLRCAGLARKLQP